mmetsp:Transcript_20739/g.59214  ORF Transcript_20739/g.59214 Transcript_20739/m.59214 type:complete len:292 (+) Transcript_20739:191-1066(+)
MVGHHACQQGHDDKGSEEDVGEEEELHHRLQPRDHHVDTVPVVHRQKLKEREHRSAHGAPIHPNLVRILAPIRRMLPDGCSSEDGAHEDDDEDQHRDPEHDVERFEQPECEQLQLFESPKHTQHAENSENPEHPRQQHDLALARDVPALRQECDQRRVQQRNSDNDEVEQVPGPLVAGAEEVSGAVSVNPDGDLEDEEREEPMVDLRPMWPLLLVKLCGHDDSVREDGHGDKGLEVVGVRDLVRRGAQSSPRRRVGGLQLGAATGQTRHVGTTARQQVRRLLLGALDVLDR